MIFEEVDEIEFVPLSRLVVTTTNTVWVLTSDSYMRLPKTEQPRSEVPSYEHRLADGVEHGLIKAWWHRLKDGTRYMRLLPSVGPPDGYGIVTGQIMHTKGPWVFAEGEAVENE